jgi:hypothetical protein
MLPDLAGSGGGAPGADRGDDGCLPGSPRRPRRGRDPETLRRQLGHASMKTTQIYFASDEAHEDSEVLAFDSSPLPLAADAARGPA